MQGWTSRPNRSSMGLVVHYIQGGYRDGLEVLKYQLWDL